MMNLKEVLHQLSTLKTPEVFQKEQMLRFLQTPRPKTVLKARSYRMRDHESATNEWKDTWRFQGDSEWYKGLGWGGAEDKNNTGDEGDQWTIFLDTEVIGYSDKHIS